MLVFLTFVGLWNHVFLFSNLSLFVLLPFAYFFTESEGFSGQRKVKYTSLKLLRCWYGFLGDFGRVFGNFVSGKEYVTSVTI